MMTTQKLKALVNTVIKQSTLDSSQITDLTQKFSLTAGDKIEINDYKSADNNHWELELTTPVNEIAKWFAYIPHVEIKSNDPVAKILQDIKQSQFKVYHRPTEQDGDGVGIPPNGQDNRSERICPVYVLSPRRQTDSLVRQMITLLPVKDTAFIIAERLLQYPEDYLPTISQFEKAVIVQSFVGVGPPQPDPTPYPDWAKKRHDKEFWNVTSVLPYDDLLAFGSWGTFGNCVGSTLAVAKILFYAKNPAAQRQLYLEAIAHDVFANGYKEVQRPEEPKSFCNQLKNQTGITFNHYDGYDNPATVKKVFEVLNRHVNVRMQEHFAGLSSVNNRVFRITPQFWRTFESEVHIWPRLPEEIHKVGIYRTDLEAIAFNPSLGDQFV